ncbi:hypothetical protein D7W82_22560 [Corallococcus sp. CA049B]|nr:hypothetical protein D7W82_22560 [Corallococcus sp. CA049B]
MPEGRCPEELWARLGPLLPSKTAPIRVTDRLSMDAVLLVLHPGMQHQELPPSNRTVMGRPIGSLAGHPLGSRFQSDQGARVLGSDKGRLRQDLNGSAPLTPLRARA